MESFLYCIAICGDECVEPAFVLSNVPLGRRSRRATVRIPNDCRCGQFDEITNLTVVIAARRDVSMCSPASPVTFTHIGWILETVRSSCELFDFFEGRCKQKLLLV